MSLSLAALLAAFVLLALVQTLRSNLHGIHKNLIAALFFSQLVFVIGIAQTENPVRPGPSPPSTAARVAPWARTLSDLPPRPEESSGRSVCCWFRPAGAAGSRVGSWEPRPSLWAHCFVPAGNLPPRAPSGAGGSIRLNSYFPDPGASDFIRNYICETQESWELSLEPEAAPVAQRLPGLHLLGSHGHVFCESPGVSPEGEREV